MNWKKVDADALDASLTTVADAIRARSGVTGELEFPNGMKEAVENFPDYVERYCNGELETYSNPRLTNAAYQVFRHREHKYYDLPNLETVQNWCFAQSKICNIALPKASEIHWDAFRECNSLTQVDLGAAIFIYTRTFYNCAALVTLIVRTNALIPLYNTDAFTGTPIASGTGYIYVPRAFLSDTDANKDYRRASNWSVFSAQFRALEDYTVDGTTTGALDPNKI